LKQVLVPDGSSYSDRHPAAGQFDGDLDRRALTLLVALEEDPAVALIPYLIVLGATALALLCPVGGQKTSIVRAVEQTFARPVARSAHKVFIRLQRFRQDPPPDPFEVLHVQLRLHAVAEEIGELEIDETVFARAARMEARMAAYDALLRNACELAGVDDLDQVTGRDGRMQRELQLTERGWSW
jgi:hypothetical protein